jgi:type IV pilus assembly protein PilA
MVTTRESVVWGNKMVLKNVKGFTLIELMIVVAIIGILALIAIPNFTSIRAKAYEASAKSMGRNAKVAMEVYYNQYGGDISGSGGYAEYLSDLLSFDRNLTDDSDVTFEFVTVTNTGYTYYTAHKYSPTEHFVFHD